MELIDNKSKLLGDDLKREIKKDAKVRMVASYFSIYAFEALKEELSGVEELQFIFPTPTFVKQGIKENISKERREYYIPKHLRETSLYGTEFEIKLRNQLTQKAIARECAEWIRSKVSFRSNVTESELQNFIYVDDNHDRLTTYTPIKGFTSVDLGYEKNNMLFQGIIKNDDPSYAKYFFNQFKSVWDDSSKVEDVTEAIVDYISSAYEDNAPEFIYFVTLYNIFSEFLDDIMSEDYLPNEGTGFRNSIVWNKLYLGKVKMIYIDPPYNTGNDFVYADDFSISVEEYMTKSGQISEEGGKLFHNTESNGRFHTDWLNMIYPRLKIARDLLTDDGIIFISIDDAEVYNLKKVCDEIFGESNFVCNFIRKNKAGSGHDSASIAIEFDYILCYSKNIKECTINQEIVDISKDQKYKLQDEYVERRGNPFVFEPLKNNNYTL